MAEPKIVILGAGSIGVAFAAAFSDCGADVVISDPDPARRAGVAEMLDGQCRAIKVAGLWCGAGGGVTISDHPDAAVTQADLVLEAGPEDLGIKRQIFARLLQQAGQDTILATASSAIPMSRILPDAGQQARALVAHPVNPPSVLRLIELVPAPGTSAAALEKAQTLFARMRFAAVTLGHEVEGFVLNRLQGAVLREAYRLVADGVADVEGIDTVMRLGLGPRWALSGPFETAELNTPGGIQAHAKRMGPAYRAMGQARGETDCNWPKALVDEVARQRRTLLPLDDLPARVSWRTEAVARLVATRDRMDGKATEHHDKTDGLA